MTRTHHHATHGIAQRTPEPIALVGIGCRYPGADGPRTFWNVLAQERDTVANDMDGAHQWLQLAGEIAAGGKSQGCQFAFSA